MLIMVEIATLASISLSWDTVCSSFHMETTLDCESPSRLDAITPMMLLSNAYGEPVLLTGGAHSTCHTESIEPLSLRLPGLWLWTIISGKV